jgi:hypothetical protein
MTKPQIWVAIFLGLFILLFVIGRMTKEDPSNGHPETLNPTPQTGMSSEELTVPELMARLGCVSCHGTDLKGTQMGPSLYTAKEFFSRDKLINYLRNPNSFMDSDRFKAYEEKYPGVIMPSFNNVDVKELGRIAEYLLRL